MATYSIALYPGDGIGVDVTIDLLADGTCRTPDLGGRATTVEVGTEIADRLLAVHEKG